jgi:putative endonuclease
VAIQPAVYILASRRNGTLYVGVTSNLKRRIWQHRNHYVVSFVGEYGVTQLVYYELHGDMHGALTREKRIKKWRREWKLRLIEEMNPDWEDLWLSIF